MRRTPVWVGWALCLCASLAASAQDYPEDDEMIPDLIRDDGTGPETGAEPAAEFLRCNKVKMTSPVFIFSDLFLPEFEQVLISCLEQIYL